MREKNIYVAGNTMAPAIATLEQLGFTVSVNGNQDCFSAIRGNECYRGDGPEAVLGLIKMIEVRGWDWRVADEQLEEILNRVKLG